SAAPASSTTSSASLASDFRRSDREALSASHTRSSRPKPRASGGLFFNRIALRRRGRFRRLPMPMMSDSRRKAIQAKQKKAKNAKKREEKAVRREKNAAKKK